MFVDWEKLLALKYNTPLEQLGFELNNYREYIYKLNDNQYILTENFTFGDDRPKYFGFVWTASKGVAEWIFLKNPMADDGANIAPPVCLLAENSITSYPVLVDYGQKKYPETFSDTVEGQTRISFGNFCYFYRKAMPAAEDFPIAIAVDLRTDKSYFSAF